MNAKILVCCHKSDIHATEAPYYGIQVGKARSGENLNMQGDDTGDNISIKNNCYCELTGMYWAWKNLSDYDIIGLCHYRRYFDFHSQCQPIKPHTSFSTESFHDLDLSIPDNILSKVASGSVVMARGKVYRYNLFTDYCTNHISDDFRILQRVVRETEPIQIRKAFFKVFHQNNRLRPCNMFIMNRKDFNEYCSWLFPLLSKVESLIDISHYSSVQQRIYGYMAERLLNVWVEARNKRIISRPIIWINDNDEPMKHYSILSYICRKIAYDISCLASRHINHDLI